MGTCMPTQNYTTLHYAHTMAHVCPSIRPMYAYCDKGHKALCPLSLMLRDARRHLDRRTEDHSDDILEGMS